VKVLSRGKCIPEVHCSGRAKLTTRVLEATAHNLTVYLYWLVVVAAHNTTTEAGLPCSGLTAASVHNTLDSVFKQHDITTPSPLLTTVLFILHCIGRFTAPVRRSTHTHPRARTHTHK
jgi:hypothetical protein